MSSPGKLFDGVTSLDKTAFSYPLDFDRQSIKLGLVGRLLFIQREDLYGSLSQLKQSLTPSLAGFAA
ncbi:MAG: hypothetical protein OK439_04305 [Thaumarchaeota archaeon]|nr:hypothetical protein [Nitrososphaerota archaeon]